MILPAGVTLKVPPRPKTFWVTSAAEVVSTSAVEQGTDGSHAEVVATTNAEVADVGLGALPRDTAL
jgi:hypothetical protein